MSWIQLNFDTELKRRLRYCRYYNPLTLLNAVGTNGPMRRRTDSCRCEAGVDYRDVGATLMKMPCIDDSEMGTCSKWKPRSLKDVVNSLINLKNVKGEKDVISRRSEDS